MTYTEVPSIPIIYNNNKENNEIEVIRHAENSYEDINNIIPLALQSKWTVIFPIISIYDYHIIYSVYIYIFRNIYKTIKRRRNQNQN